MPQYIIYVMVNDFHVERARINPPALDDSNIMDFRPIRMTEVGDFVVVDYADESKIFCFVSGIATAL